MASASLPVFRLQLSIDGDQLVDVALPRFREQLTDLREFFVRYAAPKLYRDIGRNFDTEGQFSDPGTGWAPLSPGYAAWKERHYPGRRILHRTGALETSLTFDGEKPGDGGFFEVSRTALVFGTRIKYARHHQRPSGRRPPQRRILFFMSGASETFGRLLHLFAVDMAKRNGLRTREVIREGGPGSIGGAL